LEFGQFQRDIRFLDRIPGIHHALKPAKSIALMSFKKIEG